MPPLDLSISSALITGAGSGINFEFAKLLLSEGCNVLIADIALRPESQALLDQYASGSPQAVYQKTDVTVWTDLEAAVKAGIKAFGKLDLFVPGAGVFEPPWSSFWIPPGTSPSRDLPDSNAYAQLSINLTHPIRLTQLAISHFLSRASTSPPDSTSSPSPNYATGTILHTTSIAAQLPSLSIPLYSTSKAALSSFIRSLSSLESTRNIRVCGVAPGLVKTPLFTETEKLSLVHEGKDEWVLPEEVAEAMGELVTAEGPEEVKGVMNPEAGGTLGGGKGGALGGAVLEIGKQRRWVRLLEDKGPGEGKVVRQGLAKAQGKEEEVGEEGAKGLTASGADEMRREALGKAVRGWGTER